MKRIVALLAATLVLGVGVNPVNAQVVVVGEVNQLADSAWIAREHGKKVFYFTMATRGGGAWAAGGAEPWVNPDGFGSVGKGTCHSTKNFTICSAIGQVYQLEPGNLEFDPLLGSARMRIDEPGAQHDVLWTGEGDAFTPGYGAIGGLDYAWAGFALGRYASIEGTLFGRPLKHRTPMFSMLAEGADLFAGTYIDGRRYVFNDNGTVTVHYRVAES